MYLSKQFGKGLHFVICLFLYRLNVNKVNKQEVLTIFLHKKTVHIKQALRRLEQLGIIKINSLRHFDFDIIEDKIKDFIIDLYETNNKVAIGNFGFYSIHKLYMLTFYEMLFCLCSLYTDKLEFKNNEAKYIENIVMKNRHRDLLKDYVFSPTKTTFYINIEECYKLLFEIN
jgi:hypothetical protein